MTKTRDIEKTIVDTDRTLSAAVEKSEARAKADQLKLDIHRYVWTTHPSNPTRLTQTEYADLVGLSRQTVSASVNAVEQSIRARVIQLEDIRVPSEQGKPGDGAAQDVTDEQAEKHRGSRTKVKHGNEKALSVNALAEAFGATPGTVGNGNQAHWIDRLARCEVRAREIAADAEHDTVWKRDAEKAAREIKAEYNLHHQRLATIKEGLIGNRRGLGIKVTDAQVHGLYDAAVKFAKRNDLDLDEAITDRLAFDAKDCEAGREDARQAAARSAYVLEIEQGLSLMVTGGVRVEKAMRAAAGELDLNDDEITDFGNLVNRIKGALNALDLLITGRGDWDSALSTLAAELGSA